MRHFLIFVGLWVRATPFLAHIWLRRGMRRLQWSNLLPDMIRNPERSHALGELISREFPGHSVQFVLFAEHGPEKDSKNTIWWEAPATYTVYIDDNPAFGMGVDFRPHRIDIRQLQGIQGVLLPPVLRTWPHMMVRVCIAFAEIHSLQEVRLYRADQTIFYNFPFVTRKEGMTLQESYKEVQQHMRRRYDGTARQTKMQMKQKYGVWENPAFKRPASS